jgi:hypothetical protein
MNVSGIIVTRGDVDTAPLMETWPTEWERLIWNNGSEELWIQSSANAAWLVLPYATNMGPHGRFAAIEHADHDLIYCQDDDVIVGDPEHLVKRWEIEKFGAHFGLVPPDFVVCNLPSEFRPHYPDSSLVGFGACFQRDAPERAFQRFFDYHSGMKRNDPLFLRESCRIFTTLTPKVLVDIPKTDMLYASDPDRLWKQQGHLNFRDRALTLAREVRDA